MAKLLGTMVGRLTTKRTTQHKAIIFPHRTLYAGSVTDPFPVRVVPPVDPLEPGSSDAPDTPDTPESEGHSDLPPRP